MAIRDSGIDGLRKSIEPKVSGSQDYVVRVRSDSEVFWDQINVTYPDTVTDVFAYKYSGSTVMTVTVTYTSQSKKYISSVVKA